MLEVPSGEIDRIDYAEMPPKNIFEFVQTWQGIGLQGTVRKMILSQKRRFSFPLSVSRQLVVKLASVLDTHGYPLVLLNFRISKVRLSHV